MLGSLWFKSFSSGGGGAAYELISTTVLGSSQASVTFDVSSYTSTYKHLEIRAVMRDLRPFGSSRAGWRFNSDTGSNYIFHNMRANGSDVGYDFGSATDTYISTGRIAANASPANAFASHILQLTNFGDTTKYKTTRAFTGNTNEGYISFESGLWMNTSAVTSITGFSANGYNFVAGSRFSIYGIRG